MPVKRIFVAIEIPEDVRSRIAAHVDEIRRLFPGSRVRWVRPENFHLTLRFAGNIDEKALAELIEKVEFASRNFPSFDVKIAGTGSFTRRDSGVLWIGVEGPGRERIQAIASALHPASESKAVPHLTIARMRSPQKFRELITAHEQTKLVAGSFTVDHLTVFESRLTPSGSIYSVVSEHPLDR